MQPRVMMGIEKKERTTIRPRISNMVDKIP
jgi:hypothetical protein